VPHDFLDELASELDASSRALHRHAERLAALAALHRAAAAAAQRFGLPVTIFDAVEAGRDQSERDELAEQARRLRKSGH
jgi:predicted ArsR family transcriptional regulator